MNEETIFSTALSKSSPSERAAFLDRACAGDPALRASVEALLLAHQDAGSFLEQPVLAPLDSACEQEPPKGPLPLDFLEPADLPDSIGRLGPYVISAVVGRGGMGVVLKGQDTRLNRPVAIKVLLPELASNQLARKRFLREAQAAAAVSHNHVVTTYAIDEAQRDPYIVMEYVAGCSLQDRLDREGILDVTRILRIARQTALGLAAAHEQGLIHRDVKPGNILLENGIERVKLSDFGLARAIDDASTTQTGMVAGTPQYMSPEQAQGERVDHRSDLFSLGCVMYAMCTGRSPFRAATAVAALRRVCDDRPRSILEINSDVPGWLVAIIERLLAKHPDQRFQSAAEVAELLGKCLACVEHPSPELQEEVEKLARVSAGSPRDEPRVDAEATIVQKPATPAPAAAAGRIARRRVLGGAVTAGILCLTLALTGSAKVAEIQEYLAAVLRITTPAGTLIVEVDDPAVQVTIEGEDVVIQGAGPREVRLRPGVYRLDAERGGQLLARQWVRITRDGEQVVRIDFEPPGSPEAPRHAAADESTPAPPAKIASFTGDTGVHYSACFAPGREAILANAGRQGGARLLSLPEGAELQRFPGVHGPAVFTPSGHRLVSGTCHAGSEPNRLLVWDVDSGQPLWTGPEVQGVFQALAISPDGKLAVSGHAQWWGDYQDRDQSLRVWDLERQKLLHRISGHADQVMAVGFGPDGQTILSGSRDGTVRLWSTESGQELKRFEGPATEVFAVAVSPDGRFMLAGYGPDVESGIQGRMIDDPQHCVAVMWEAETGREVQRFTGHRGCIRQVGFSPDGQIVVTASGEAHVGEPLPDGGSKKTRDNSARLWDAASGRQLARIDHRTSLKSASFSADGRFLLTGQWHTIQLWEIPDSLGEATPSSSTKLALPRPLLVSSNRGGDFDIYCVRPSSREAGDEAAGAADHRWINLSAHPAEDTGPAWSPDGSKIAFCSSRSGNLDIWLMNADGSDPQQLTDFPGIDRTPCWSPDGRRIAFVRHVSRDNWDVFAMDCDGANLVNLTDHPGKEADPAWSPDGRTIAYSFDSDGTHLYLMDADGSRPRLLSARKGMFSYPAWAPDGSRLVFTGWAGEVGGDLELFVVAADGSDERQLTHCGGLNTFAAWSPDGQIIAFQHRNPNTAGSNTTICLIGADGAGATALSGPEGHIGYGGGRPAWQPLAAQ